MAAPQSFKDPIMTQEREAVARVIGSWPMHDDDRGPDNTVLHDLLPGSYDEATALLYKLTDAILALRSGGEGWRLVPVEPTEAMLDAVAYEFPRSAPFVFGKLWAAMLAAAPSPSTQGEG